MTDAEATPRERGPMDGAYWTFNGGRVELVGSLRRLRNKAASVLTIGPGGPKHRRVHAHFVLAHPEPQSFNANLVREGASSLRDAG